MKNDPSSKHLGHVGMRGSKTAGGNSDESRRAPPDRGSKGHNRSGTATSTQTSSSGWRSGQASNRTTGPENGQSDSGRCSRRE